MKQVHVILNCVLLFVLLKTNCIAQSPDSIIKNWKSFHIPQNEDSLIQYNHGKIWWKVVSKGGEIYAYNRYEGDDDFLPFKTKITLTEKFLKVKGNRSVLKVPDGFLVGIDYGEWGGNLSWYGNLYTSHKEISGNRILKFLTVANRIYALDGDGKIIELKKVKDKWIVEDVITLPSFPFSYPGSFSIDSQNNFIVITNESLMKIDNEGIITYLIKDGFWKPYLYPHSMVIKEDVVYVGMPRGIFKYNLVTKKKEWLMPD